MMLKKSFSLIELIFTIVIIAMIFTVIPKVIYVTNLSIRASMKEDGIFNMMAHIMDISLQEWDENNTADSEHPDYILLTGKGDVLDCNSSIKNYRIGGFKGGRSCPNYMNVSHIGPDANENDTSDYDDVDDYNGTEENATKIVGNSNYTIYDSVGYSDEWNKTNYNYSTKTLDFNETNSTNKNEKNIKYIEVTLQYNRGGIEKNISHARYWSSNIGHMYIESRQW
jgi:hypothetical protein